MTDAPRKNIMLGTAGHVDHGKTALVRLLTGCNTDRLTAEQQRGLTIELGFAPCTMADDRIVGIVDVPGHVDFIRNMVAGAHGVDVVVLVIAADDSVMPQTREHMDLLTILGCRAGLVALTKIDLIDEELRQMVLADVRGFLQGTFLENAPICPVSNITGEGFDDFFAALNGVVDSVQPSRHLGRFRQWSERSFAVKGFGTVATGIPTAGQVRVGDTLQALPADISCRVRTLEVYGRSEKVGRAGECVALNLSDTPAATVGRGTLLCAPDTCRSVTCCEADLTLLPHLPTPLPDNAEVHVHLGTAERMGKCAILDGARTVSPGESRLVQLRLREPLPVAPGDRFAIRGQLAGVAGGRVTTLGGGRILDAGDIKLRRNRPWTVEKLSARRDALDSPPRWLEQILREADTPLRLSELAARANLPEQAAAELLKELRDSQTVLETDGRYIHAAAVEELAARTIEALSDFHNTHPLRLGVAPGDLRDQLGASTPLLNLALDHLHRRGRLDRSGNVLALEGHSTRLPAEDIELCGRIVRNLEQAALEPPLPADLARKVGVAEDRLEALLTRLDEGGQIVRLDRKVAMHPSAIEQAKAAVLELFRTASGFTTAEFRDALGVSRKYAIPLLDYLDTLKWTVRTASRRTPGAAAKERM
ncbi:MAG: selenocysteine-specific translation elongation factor [Phycisphaerae bacterium]